MKEIDRVLRAMREYERENREPPKTWVLSRTSVDKIVAETALAPDEPLIDICIRGVPCIVID